MSLTKSDLKQIGNVVDERLEVKLELKLRPIKKDIRYIKKTASVLVGRSDREETQLKKRVSRIEHHLALPEEN